MLITIVIVSLWRAARRGDRLVAGTCAGTAGFLVTCTTGHPLLVTSGQFALAVVLTTTYIATDDPATLEPGVGAQLEDHRQRLVSRPVEARLLLVGIVAAVVGIGAQATATAQHLNQRTSLQGKWGYSSGLYPTERDSLGEYRWTAGEASLLLILPADASDLVVRYGVPEAPRRAGVTRVEFFLDGVRIPAATHLAAGWHTALLPLPDRAPSPSGAPPILLRVIVTPVLNPSASGLSDDHRDLGIMLRVPTTRPESATRTATLE